MLGVFIAAAIASAVPAKPAAAEAPVCYKVPVEGSRIAQKVCLPAAEFARRQAQARRILEQRQPDMGYMVGPMH